MDDELNEANVGSQLSQIRQLWKEHLRPFPRSLAGHEVDSIDLVLLDSTIAGCVSTFLARGTLDLWRTAVLGLCYQDVRIVYPILNMEGSAYFWQLERMAELVLKEVARMANPDNKACDE